MESYQDTRTFLRATVKHEGECGCVRKELEGMLKDRQRNWCDTHCILSSECNSAEHNMKWAQKWLDKNDVSSKLTLI